MPGYFKLMVFLIMHFLFVSMRGNPVNRKRGACLNFYAKKKCAPLRGTGASSTNANIWRACAVWQPSLRCISAGPVIGDENTSPEQGCKSAEFRMRWVVLAGINNRPFVGPAQMDVTHPSAYVSLPSAELLRKNTHTTTIKVCTTSRIRILVHFA